LFDYAQHDTINHPCLNEAKMSLKHAAQHLAAHGRGPDTMLVHMTPGEVKSLNDIAMAHGGQLTTNPHTGLPEAGFLSSLLPMLAGGALTVMSGGAINPLTAGLLVGGGTAVVTGDIKKGLMAGLGAYGGAGIGTGLTASGTQAAALEPTATAASATPPPPSVVMQPPPVAAPSTPFANIGDPNMTQMFSQAAPSTPITPESLGVKPLPTTPSVIGSGYSDALANQQAAFQTGTTGQNLSTIGKGIQSLGTEAGRSTFMNTLENTPYTYGAKTTLAAAALPTAYNMYEESKPKQKTTPVDSDPGQQFDYQANAINPTPTAGLAGQENKYFNPQYVKRSTPRFADGGMAYGGPTGHLRPPPAFFQNGKYSFHPAKMYAEGGVPNDGYNLGGYSDGGRLLRGPGDGVSDSIPAVIGKKQPARLADGEFVVPARIVSELGNGSTEAGARKLYAMMDRIQKARGSTVGRGRVAKNSRAEKYLPA